jgi:serine/threonine protein kinase
MKKAPFEPGEILNGKYRIERVLGAGAMGVVVSAVHLALGQRVALKFMQLRGERDPVLEERFFLEARIAAMLKSEHVARVFDVGVLENGSPYLVMELLEGQDLSRVIKARGQLPIGEAVDYVAQACEALSEAHAAGIIHRDLKPANLFLTTGADGSPCVKVLDFGVSKLVGSELDLTRTGDGVGSPLYTAPEQMRSARDVEGRADVWSLGAILYELLAGRTPFHADTMMALCQRLLTDAPTPIGHYRADVPPPLAAAILRCVEKPRELRWPDVAAFRAEILPYVSARPLSSDHGDCVTPNAPMVATAPALVTSAGAARARSGGGLFAWAAVALGVAAAAMLGLTRVVEGGAPVPGAPPSVHASEPELPPAPITMGLQAPTAPSPSAAVPERAADASAPPSHASSAAPVPSARPRPRPRQAQPAPSVDYNER